MKKYQIVFVTTIVVITFVFGCTKDEGIVGKNFLGNDKINVNVIERTNLTFDLQPDIERDVSGSRYSLIGTYNDPVFGKSIAGTTFQLRILNNPGFADTMFFDSVKLFLFYNEYYGDTSFYLKANVYELDGDLFFSQQYKNSFDITPLLGKKIGEKVFNRRTIYDSIFLKSTVNPGTDSVDVNGNKVIDKLVFQLAINLEHSFGEKIFKGDPSFFESGDAFLKLLKGICILPDDIPHFERGAIYNFDLLSRFSALTLYYHYFFTNSDGNVDTAIRQSNLRITENSAVVNLYKHDNSGTTYKAVMDGTLTADTLYYLQGMAGSKLYFEIPDINSWKDSTGIVINQALLTFDVSGDSIYFEEFPLPPVLQLDALNKDGEVSNITQETFSFMPRGVTSNYLSNDNSYFFLLPSYLQEIVKGEKVNDGFELYVYNTKMNQRRVKLLNREREHIKLEITYTKTQ